MQKNGLNACYYGFRAILFAYFLGPGRGKVSRGLEGLQCKLLVSPFNKPHRSPLYNPLYNPTLRSLDYSSFATSFWELSKKQKLSGTQTGPRFHQSK